MNKSKITEPVGEGILEKEEVIVEKKDDTLSNVIEVKDYLNPNLFDDVRVVTNQEIEASTENEKISDEIDQAYLATLVDISEHQLIKGRVVGLNERDVLIDIGFKSEGIVDRNEFSEDELPMIGDQVEVYLEFLEDAGGNTILSKEKADFLKRWRDLREAFENQTTISGKIIRRIKGGMVVDLEVVQAFLPGSQIDVRPIQDFDIYLNKIKKIIINQVKDEILKIPENLDAINVDIPPKQFDLSLIHI